MAEHSFKFQMQVTGRERKEVAGLIASHFGVQAVYQGTRGFGYLTTEPGGREWLVDKAGAVVTQGQAKDNAAEVFTVLKVLDENAVEAEDEVAITIPTEGHSGVTLRNLVNILASKERLIAKAMGTIGQPIVDPTIVEKVNAARLKTIEDFFEAAGSEASPGLVITQDTITFHWFTATLNPEIVQAYVQFAAAVNDMALSLKHSSPQATKTENEKYSFRVFLLRLGFVGEKYSATRKLFLGRLEGNMAFKTQEQAKEAAKKRKKKPTVAEEAEING